MAARSPATSVLLRIRNEAHRQHKCQSVRLPSDLCLATAPGSQLRPQPKSMPRSPPTAHPHLAEGVSKYLPVAEVEALEEQVQVDEAQIRRQARQLVLWSAGMVGRGGYVWAGEEAACGTVPRCTEEVRPSGLDDAAQARRLLWALVP